jgi:hypothetical protein
MSTSAILTTTRGVTYVGKRWPKPVFAIEPRLDVVGGPVLSSIGCERDRDV